MCAIRKDRELNCTLAQKLDICHPRIEQWVKEQIDLSENKLSAHVGKQPTPLEEQIGEHLL
jgi:hypothetical protein